MLRIGEQQQLIPRRAHRGVERRCLSTRLIAAHDTHVRRADEVVWKRMWAQSIHADDHLESVRVMRRAEAVGDSRTNRLDVVSRGDDDRD